MLTHAHSLTRMLARFAAVSRTLALRMAPVEVSFRPSTRWHFISPNSPRVFSPSFPRPAPAFLSFVFAYLVYFRAIGPHTRRTANPNETILPRTKEIYRHRFLNGLISTKNASTAEASKFFSRVNSCRAAL